MIVDESDCEDGYKDACSDGAEPPIGHCDAKCFLVGLKSPTDIGPDQQRECGTPEHHRDECLRLLEAPILAHEPLLHRLLLRPAGFDGCASASLQGWISQMVANVGVKGEMVVPSLGSL